MLIFEARTLVRMLLERLLVTTCKRSLGQGHVFTGVCLSTGGGVGFPACIIGHMTRGSASRGRGSASRGRGSVSRGRGSASRGRGSASRGLGRPPPLELGKRVVRILLECFLVENVFIGRDSSLSTSLYVPG